MLGILSAFAAAVFASSKDIVSKSIAHKLSGVVSALASFLFCLPFYLILLAVQWALTGNPFYVGPGCWLMVVFRSLSDTVAEWCKMECLRYGDVSLLSGFISLAPLFLLFLSPLITGDKLSIPGIFAVLLVVIAGLIAVWKPGEKHGGLPLKGVALAVASAFFFALNNCFDRLAVQQASPIVSGFLMSALSAGFLFPFAFRKLSRGTDFSSNLKPFALRVLLGAAFMTTKLYALQSIRAPYVMAVVRCSLLISIIGGHFFLGERDTGRRLIAGLLILIGTIIIAFM